MDFKTRFQGKISHISKDGAFDNVIMSTSKMVPIGGKTPYTGGVLTPVEGPTPTSISHSNAGAFNY